MTMSLRIPLFQKMRLNRISAVSRVVGNPERGTSFQALEKRSTVTNVTQLGTQCSLLNWVSQLQRSIPMCDQGWWRMGIGARSCLRGADEESWTGHRLSNYRRTWWHHGTYWATSNCFGGATGSVSCLDVQKPGTWWTEPRRDYYCEVGTYIFPSGPPSGAGSVRVAARMSWSMFHWIVLMMRAGGRIGSGLDSACRWEKGIRLAV